MDRGAWRATVQGVAKSWTRLSDGTRTFLNQNFLPFKAEIHTHTHTHTQSIVLIHTTTVENSKVVPQKTAIHGSNPSILDDVAQVL